MDARVGAALIAVGIVLVLIPHALIVRHALVYVIDKDLFFYSNYPEGTEVEPFVVNVGTTMAFNVSATCHCINTATNEELWAIYGEWEAEIWVHNSSETWERGTILLSKKLTYVTGDAGYKWKDGTRYWCYFYVFDGVSWTPDVLGYYLVTFLIHVYEGYGAERVYVDLVTKEVPVLVEETPVPDGYFRVEGVDTRTVTRTICVDGVIDMEFFATAEGGVIGEVYVKIYVGETWVTTVTFTEVEADYKWEGSWTAKPGTYELRGYVRYDEEELRKMTLLVSFEPEEAPPYRLLPRLTALDYLGILLAAAGAFLLLRRRWGR